MSTMLDAHDIHEVSGPKPWPSSSILLWIHRMTWINIYVVFNKDEDCWMVLQSKLQRVSIL